MKLTHEEIKERLPEYFREEDIPEEIKAHIDSCADCREEFLFLAGLREAGAAGIHENADLFFKTLPRKVRISLKGRKTRRNLLFRFASAAALIVIIIAIGYFHQPKTPEETYPSSDPFSYQFTDLSWIRENDIPSIADTLESNGAYAGEKNPFEYSYHKELVSLSSENIKSFVETLDSKQKKGGVS